MKTDKSISDWYKRVRICVSISAECPYNYKKDKILALNATTDIFFLSPMENKVEFLGLLVLPAATESKNLQKNYTDAIVP